MLSTINYADWKVEFQIIKILFKSDHYHRHSGNERHFKKDHEWIWQIGPYFKPYNIEFIPQQAFLWWDWKCLMKFDGFWTVTKMLGGVIFHIVNLYKLKFNEKTDNPGIKWDDPPVKRDNPPVKRDDPFVKTDYLYEIFKKILPANQNRAFFILKFSF